MANGASSQSATNNQPSAAADGPTGLPQLAALVRDYHADVYRYACRLCGCPTEAEDFTQQTFLIAQQKLHHLREPACARSWLLSIVRSCFLKSLAKARPVAALDIDLPLEEVSDRTPEVAEIDREQLAAAIAELPEDFRVVVLMFYFENVSYQQIAEELKIPIGTVMSRLSRAKGHLRRRLGPEPAEAKASLPERFYGRADNNAPSARTPR
jgi:RNA polymerase sigma-70 factor (ECF subfamily)